MLAQEGLVSLTPHTKLEPRAGAARMVRAGAADHWQASLVLSLEALSCAGQGLWPVSQRRPGSMQTRYG